MNDVDVQPRWGVGDAAMAIAVGIVLQVTAASIYLAATKRGAGEGNDLSLAAVALLEIPLWVGLLGIPWWATRTKGKGLVADLGLRQRRTDPPIGFGLGVLVQAVVVPLLYLPFFWLLPSFDSELVERPARELTDKADGLGVVLLVLIVVLAAPVIEEICYRGLLMRALTARYGPTWGLAGSSTIFAASHFQVVQFPALLVFGLVAGYLAQRTGRLGLSIWLHVGFNAWSVFALLALTN